MKITKFLLLAVLLISIGSLQTVRAQEHPEHPKKTEHPKKAEHPEHPVKAGNIFAVASESGHFNTFCAAVKAAGLENKFQSKGPFTIFAPTDEAFAKLPDGMLEDLLKPANKAMLAGLLANHVVPGKIMASDIKTMKATNVSGQDLAIQVSDGHVTVNEAQVVHADVAATNGVIHAIDTVMVPAPPTGDGASAKKPKDHPAH
jgi:uncharacterized surface protein with fasciclin (FAS1) repeats